MTDTRQPWSVLVEAVVTEEAGGAAAVDDDMIEELAAILAEVAGYDVHVVVTGGAGHDHVGARVVLEALNGVDAVMEAASLFETAASKVGLPDPHSVARLEALTVDELERELDRPTFPDIVGVTEAATLLAVSKQRVSELAKTRSLPPPMAVLAATPVWLRSSIEAFAAGWSRTPGRPRSDA